MLLFPKVFSEGEPTRLGDAKALESANGDCEFAIGVCVEGRSGCE